MDGLMGRGGGGWSVALAALDALTIRVADVWVFAYARRSAFAFQAFLGHLWVAVDQEGWWSVAGGHAVQLGAAIIS